MTKTGSRKQLGRILTVVGVLLLAYLVHRLGLRTLWTTIVQFGPWYLPICVIGAAALLCQAGAWWLIMRDFFQRVALLELFRVKIISDGFNMILPSASLGGDAMRAFLIRERVPLSVGVPAVLFDKTIEFVASVVFLGSGLLLGLLSLRLPVTLIVPAVISLAITSVGIVLLVVVQKRGVTRSLLMLSMVHPAVRRWVLARESKLLAMDESLGLLYTRSNHRALLPVAVHVLCPVRRRVRGDGHPGGPRHAGQLYPGPLHRHDRDVGEHRLFPVPRAVGRDGERPRARAAKHGVSCRRRPQPGPDPENTQADVRRRGAGPAGAEEALVALTRRSRRAVA